MLSQIYPQTDHPFSFELNKDMHVSAPISSRGKMRAHVAVFMVIRTPSISRLRETS